MTGNSIVRNSRVMIVAILVATFFVAFLDAAYASAPPPPPVPVPMAATNTFSQIAFNINTSIASLPGLLTGVSYLFATLLGVKGVIRIKDHVENPNQTPLKDATVLLLAGGALFALPIVYESMFNTIGTTDNLVSTAALNRVKFNVN